MNSPNGSNWGGRPLSLLPPTGVRHSSLAIAFWLLVLLPCPSYAATNVVTTLADSGEGSLREAITVSAPGDTITFATSNGVLTLTQVLTVDRDLIVLGPGRTKLTISGNHLTRIFNVSENVTALISGFTLQSGHSASGADGQVVGGTTLTPGEPGQPGGAIWTAGTLTLADCDLRNNAAGNGGNGLAVNYSATSGGNGGGGGAIYNTGNLTLTNCALSRNASGVGGRSGEALTYSPRSGDGGPGGAIWSSGVLQVLKSTFSDNQTGFGNDTPREARGANGGSGGGIWSRGPVTATDSVFLRNSTGHGGYGGPDSMMAGSGGTGGDGGGIWCGGLLALTNCTFSSNYCGFGGAGGGATSASGSASAGGGGSAGAGCGLFSTNTTVLVRCSVSGNYGSYGGLGGSGDYASGGGTGSHGAGIYADGDLSMTDCTVSYNTGGKGGDGGRGFGGMIMPPYGRYGGGGGTGGEGAGIYALRGLWLTNCTVTGNTCGNGGSGGAGSTPDLRGSDGWGGSGGGIAWIGRPTGAVVVSCSIVGNHAGAGNYVQGSDGTGGGVAKIQDEPFQSLNSIIARNTGVSCDVSGSFISHGHNLVGVTNGSSGFGVSGDRVGSAASPLDPRVAPLAANGGPTLTLGLLPGSPAIDSGTADGVPLADQRGVRRPQGAGVDIGAFEYQFTIPEITAAAFQGAAFGFLCCGLPESAYTLQVSTNLQAWSDLAGFMTDLDGVYSYVDPGQMNPEKRFFRLRTR